MLVAEYQHLIMICDTVWALRLCAPVGPIMLFSASEGPAAGLVP